MKQNATVKAAYSYLYILGDVTDLSLEKTWVFFFFNWRKHYGVLFNLQGICLRSDMKRMRKTIRNQCQKSSPWGAWGTPKETFSSCLDSPPCSSQVKSLQTEKGKAWMSGN